MATETAYKQDDVERLRIFDSVLTKQFDSTTSDVGFLITFQPGRGNMCHNYSDLTFALEQLAGRDANRLTERDVKNPFFTSSAVETAQDL